MIRWPPRTPTGSCSSPTARSSTTWRTQPPTWSWTASSRSAATRRKEAEMFKLTIKELAGKKLRLITTALAVMLGVAFMAGTLVLTDTIGKSFDGLFAEAYSGMDAYVRGERVIQGSNDTPSIDASTLDTVRSVPGVEAASGVVSGYAQLVDHDGKAIGNPGTGAPTLGDAWLDDPELNFYDLVDGHAPVAPDEIV